MTSYSNIVVGHGVGCGAHALHTLGIDFVPRRGGTSEAALGTRSLRTIRELAIGSAGNPDSGFKRGRSASQFFQDNVPAPPPWVPGPPTSPTAAWPLGAAAEPAAAGVSQDHRACFPAVVRHTSIEHQVQRRRSAPPSSSDALRGPKSELINEARVVEAARLMVRRSGSLGVTQPRSCTPASGRSTPSCSPAASPGRARGGHDSALRSPSRSCERYSVKSHTSMKVVGDAPHNSDAMDSCGGSPARPEPQVAALPRQLASRTPSSARQQLARTPLIVGRVHGAAQGCHSSAAWRSGSASPRRVDSVLGLSIATSGGTTTPPCFGSDCPMHPSGAPLETVEAISMTVAHHLRDLLSPDSFCEETSGCTPTTSSSYSGLSSTRASTSAQSQSLRSEAARATGKIVDRPRFDEAYVKRLVQRQQQRALKMAG